VRTSGGRGRRLRGGPARRRALLFAATLAICVGCDHAAKRIAGCTLGSKAISLAGESVRLELVHNPGAFLSLASELRAEVRGPLFLVLVPLAVAALCVLALRSGFSSGRSFLGLGLVAGGGLGNWLDRLLHGGAVTDFVSLGVGPLRTGIFNLADVCIVGGALLLLLLGPGARKREGRARPVP
jgi:signal peptidase II